MSAKTAIVTGAAQGIGRAIALRLATDGYNVLISDINATKLDAVRDEILKAGKSAASLAGDIAKKETVQGLVAKAVELFGGLDVVGSHMRSLYAEYALIHCWPEILHLCRWLQMRVFYKKSLSMKVRYDDLANLALLTYSLLQSTKMNLTS